MATIDPISPWIPADDLLLKNAMEVLLLKHLQEVRCASLNKFTVREFKDRWRSLLYDPEVSNIDSGRMVEFELSSVQLPVKSVRGGSSKSTPQVLAKRKVDSVPKLYYEMRKRLRLEACNTIDLDFPNKPLHNEPKFEASNYQLQHIHNEKIVPFQPFPVIDLSRKDSLKTKQVPDFDFIYNDMGKACSGFVGMQCTNSPISDDSAVFHSMGFSSPLRQGPVWNMTEDVSAPHIPIDMNLREKDDHVEAASLLPNNNVEENIHFMDVDLNTMDRYCDYNLNSLLLSSPNNSNEDDDSNTTEPPMQLSNTFVASPSGLCPEEIVVIALQSTTNLDIQHNVCCLNDTVPSSSTVTDPNTYEASGRVIFCALNTEDQDIPCNDHIFPSKEFHHPATQVPGQDTLTSHPNRIERGANNYHVELDQCGPTYISAKVSMSRSRDKDKRAKLKELDAPAILGQHSPLHVEPDLTANLAMEEVYSDDDLPSFSDVEGMILEMDPFQHVEDSLLSNEVTSYQHKDNKRQIVRLEQSAQASLRRAIASQGDLAILHGHYSRHYIKKVEVILGRATDDIDVDIDLATEGRANRISRRQASIKMDKCGSFYLKNLGKSSISVNGKDVATGQYLTLSSSCLIEIRELRFVFEVNHKSIRRFLENYGGKFQQNNGKFEWSCDRF